MTPEFAPGARAGALPDGRWSEQRASGDEPIGANGAPLLEAEGICASYSSYRALFGVSIAVPRGSAVALLGANGAGKSTLARVLTGLVPPTEGRIRFQGTDVTGWQAWRIARLGMAHVPEGRGIFASLSVEENLSLFFRRRLGRSGVGQALDRAYGAFPILAERRRQQAGTLSGGQQRMLSLAKVLAAPPRLLVADELSLGLAPVVVDSVYESLAAIRAAGTSLLVVEQHVDRALALAERAVVLAKGAVAWEGEAAHAAEAMRTVLRGSRAD